MTGTTDEKRLKLVYVAGPFRAKNSWQIERNIRRAEEIAYELWWSGYAVICPHTNTRFFHGTPVDYVEGYLEIVRRCDAVVVVPNWGMSSGTLQEIALAKELEIPIYYWPDYPELSGARQK